MGHPLYGAQGHLRRGDRQAGSRHKRGFTVRLAAAASVYPCIKHSSNLAVLMTAFIHPIQKEPPDHPSFHGFRRLYSFYAKTLISLISLPGTDAADHPHAPRPDIPPYPRLRSKFSLHRYPPGSCLPGK
ncbi:hypothetical protein D3C73_1365820 [compost metagenome]